jgi:hypothetical protein
MKVKADRDEASPYAAMLAAQDVAERCKQIGVNALHVKLRVRSSSLRLLATYPCTVFLPHDHGLRGLHPPKLKCVALGMAG